MPFLNSFAEQQTQEQPQEEPLVNNKAEGQNPVPAEPREVRAPPPPLTMIEEINSIKLRAAKNERPKLEEAQQKEEETRKIIALQQGLGVPLREYIYVFFS